MGSKNPLDIRTNQLKSMSDQHSYEILASIDLFYAFKIKGIEDNLEEFSMERIEQKAHQMKETMFS